jgi:hypothetical protein
VYSEIPQAANIFVLRLVSSSGPEFIATCGRANSEKVHLELAKQLPTMELAIFYFPTLENATSASRISNALVAHQGISRSLNNRRCSTGEGNKAQERRVAAKKWLLPERHRERWLYE